MKITIKLLLIAFAALYFVGCSKDAEVSAYLTDERLGEIAAEDPDKAFSAAEAGLYSDMQQYVYSHIGGHLGIGQKGFDELSSSMGNDMVHGMWDFHGFWHILDYAGEGYAPTARRWAEYYRVIANANNILAQIDPEITNPEVLRYKALALGFRGYAYAQLSYIYQFSYYVGADGTKWGKGAKYDWSQALSVPLVTEVITGKQPRATVEQIHNQIVSDLTSSYEIFEEIEMVKTSSPTDFDGTVSAMYLARAHMVKHEWAEAAKYADIVIKNYKILTTEDQLMQGFSDISAPNVVFGFDVTADTNIVLYSYFSQMDAYGAGYAGSYPRGGFKPFVDRIPASDIRLNWFATERSSGLSSRPVDPSKPDGAKLPWLVGLKDREVALMDYQSTKFIGVGRPNLLTASSGDYALGDNIYLRAEEAHFIKMEALAHLGDASAVTLLNDFVVTRDPEYAYTFTNKADLIEEINYQKRLEHWGEGIEYLDNRRLNIPIDRTDATWGAENNNHVIDAKQVHPYSNQEDLWLRYQIPLSLEIQTNDLIQEQNEL